MKKMILAAAVVCLAVVSASAFAQEDGFVSLFNGNDLTGWSGDARLWSVEDGAIVGRTDNDAKKIVKNSFLIYDKPFSNFVLRFDFRITQGGNSGMQYRAWKLEDETPFRLGGYQGDFDGAATYSGIVYGEAFRGILAERGTVSAIGDDHKPKAVERFASNDDLKKLVKIEDWNSYEIIADGFSFEHKINGVTMSKLTDDDTDTRRSDGLLGIQVHAGLPVPMEVRVKNIRIKEL